MKRETEDMIMGWYIIMAALLFAIAIFNATPVSKTKTCECTEVN